MRKLVHRLAPVVIPSIICGADKAYGIWEQHQGEGFTREDEEKIALRCLEVAAIASMAVTVKNFFDRYF